MRQHLIRWLNRIGISLVVAALLVFAGDSLSLRLQIPNHRPQFGSVRVKPYYAVKLKNGKTEFMFTDPQDETCTWSLLPQLGYRPCWYVARKPMKRIDVK